ncbi:hypothetical protein [Pseudenhygromyxa sp. WMMC2535]|nr:hypothetical protein [Pseudenhygromyxa sp. WMMC2535]
MLFSDIGRVNIIAGPEVQGSVTMKLSAVPWVRPSTSSCAP